MATRIVLGAYARAAPICVHRDALGRVSYDQLQGPRFVDLGHGYPPAIAWFARVSTWTREEWQRRGAFGTITIVRRGERLMLERRY